MAVRTNIISLQEVEFSPTPTKCSPKVRFLVVEKTGIFYPGRFI